MSERTSIQVREDECGQLALYDKHGRQVDGVVWMETKRSMDDVDRVTVELVMLGGDTPLWRQEKEQSS